MHVDYEHPMGLGLLYLLQEGMCCYLVYKISNIGLYVKSLLEELTQAKEEMYKSEYNIYAYPYKYTSTRKVRRGKVTCH